MPGKKKRLSKLAEAVASILGNKEKAKKLKKAEALERFIAKLIDREKEIRKELSAGGLKGQEAKEKARQVKILVKQTKKARKILADIK